MHSLQERPELGMAAIGFMDFENRSEPIEGVRCLGLMNDVRDAVAEHRPDRIVVGCHGTPGSSADRSASGIAILWNPD